MASPKSSEYGRDQFLFIVLFSFEHKLLEELNELDVLEIQPGTVLLKENEYIKLIPN
jgi:hypothetical protein